MSTYQQPPGYGACDRVSDHGNAKPATHDPAASPPTNSERGREASDLLPLVYQQLRALAQRGLQAERPDHTLTATALVHEAYLRLSADRTFPWGGEAHYYVAAAESMRRILLDHAKSRNRVKRGGGRKRAPINILDLAAEPDLEEFVALDKHLCRLENEHPEAAEVVRLRFFTGLTIDRTAEVLGRSPRQVDRLWSYARAWLYRALQDD